MNLEQIKNLLRENGIVGAGGAGFPTYAKLDKKADTLILNCAECEPLLRLHRQVLKMFTYEILSTLDLISKILEVETVYIGIKGSYKRTLEAVNAELTSFPNMKVCTLPEVYPAGDEVVLTYEATGRVVPAGSIPLSVGVTVLNVETVYNIYRALEGSPVTHKYVTVTGEVKNPITVYAPIGVPLQNLIDMAGGITIEDPAYLIGGPMMGKLGSPTEPVTKTTNAVLVLPKNLPLVQKKLSKTSIDLKRAMSACCQCSYCTSLCPRQLLGHPIDPSAFMYAASNHVTCDVMPYVNSMFCSGCGLCEMYSCGQGLSPRALLTAAKNGLRKNGLKPPQDPNMHSVHPDRQFRMIPLSRLRSRLGLNPYNKSAPVTEDEVRAKKLKIALSQHIGAPAVPVVNKGDKVLAGQLIAEAAPDALSVAIHASMSGTVADINKKYITILVSGGTE
ncbi:MAG: SLBB domain-containing protein [Clostridia bacterium]|nr:SLBB domain-containing protein [Clostridia bacterium]